MKLTKAKIAAANKKGRYGDGRGLWLVVGPNGRKTWAFLYSLNKKARHMGLGAIEFLTLDQARDRALELRRLVKRGIDPLAQQEAERAANQGRLPPSERRVPTFDEVAVKVIEQRTKNMTNEKAKAQWSSTLQTYVYPTLKGVPVNRITSSDVLNILEPIWHEKAETASRVRQRVSNVLDYAASHDWLGEGELAKIKRAMGNLQKQSKNEIEGHASMPYAEVPAFAAKLRNRPGFAARALAFLILTAGRSGEIRGATWDEIDLEAAVWSIPKDRMKKKKPHLVPLSAPALALLRALPREEGSTLVFPSPTKRDSQLSDNTLRKVMLDMGRDDAVPHGFRSSFRTWVSEQTSFPREIAEAALAHTNQNKVEAAYNRTNYLERRVPLMEAWATFVADTATDDKVVPIRSAG